MEKDFIHQQLLGALGDKELSSLESNYEGRTWRDFIIEALPPKLKKKGAKSEKYKQVHIMLMDFSFYFTISCRRKSYSSILQREDF